MHRQPPPPRSHREKTLRLLMLMLRAFALMTAVALMCSPVVADKDDNHATQLQLADEYQKALEEIAHLRQQVEHLRGDSLSRHKKEPPAANMLQRVNTDNKPKPISLGEVQTARGVK